MRSVLTTLAYGSCLLFACTATETGNPVASQGLALTARSSSANVELGSSAGGAGVHVGEAWVVVGEFRFVQAARCDSGGSAQADIKGPFAMNLVEAPLLLDLAVEATRYCRVRVKLDRADKNASAVPSALADHSILIRGERADGTAFELRSRDNRDADIRSHGEPFSIDRASAGLILAFDVGRWLDGLDLEHAEPASDGAIHIDENGDRDRLDRFEANVEAAMELFRDDNRDHELDPTEAETPLASGGT